MEYKKLKSAYKSVSVRGQKLSGVVLDTMKTISDIVGATLGPGGCPVLIERYEFNVPPVISKDGVSVFRSLAFQDPTRHCIMECARDAAIRTVSSAGDGTTSSAVLAEAFVRNIDEFCRSNPHISPQKIVRKLESSFRDFLEPLLKQLSVKVDFMSEDGQKVLTSVAQLSANGDEPLAKAVMECYRLVGDEGNITLTEGPGESRYEIEVIDGFPIPMGYEQSCGTFATKFVNDTGTQMTKMENPVFVLYNGKLTELQTIYKLLAQVGNEYELKITGQDSNYDHHNVVVVANEFSDGVVAAFAAGFQLGNSISVFPLKVPLSPINNGHIHFLEDLVAITGATLFDPINKPLDTGTLADLGPGVKMFECSRWRSNIIGRAEGECLDGSGLTYEDLLLNRVSDLEALAKNPESELDKIIFMERIAKLTGGIAKLKIFGSSNGEAKEKRDRAEDAICAVRGAIQHGCLPGGGWALLKANREYMLQEFKSEEDRKIMLEVMCKSLFVPFEKMLKNCGFNEDEIDAVYKNVSTGIELGKTTVYDAYNHQYGDAFELGILDSAPAVIESIRNSISIASLLGTLGGTVVFGRDEEYERREAGDHTGFLRNAGEIK